jgi:hypothetical protein
MRAWILCACAHPMDARDVEDESEIERALSAEAVEERAV